MAWDDQSFNSFTVTNGSITESRFAALDYTSGNTFFCLYFGVSLGCSGEGFSGNSLLFFDSSGNAVVNNNPFSGVTFAAATPVPFEVNPTLGLLLVGGLLGGNLLYRNHKGRKIKFHLAKKPQ